MKLKSAANHHLRFSQVDIHQINTDSLVEKYRNQKDSRAIRLEEHEKKKDGQEKVERPLDNKHIRYLFNTNYLHT